MNSLRGGGADYLVPWLVSSAAGKGSIDVLVYEAQPNHDASLAAVSVHKSLLDACVASLSAKYRAVVTRVAHNSDAERVRQDTLAEVRAAIMSSNQLNFAATWPPIAAIVERAGDKPSHVRQTAQAHVRAMAAFLVTRDVADASAGQDHETDDPFDVNVSINMTHLNSHSAAAYNRLKLELFVEAAATLACTGKDKLCYPSPPDEPAKVDGENVAAAREWLCALHLYANVAGVRIGHERLVGASYTKLPSGVYLDNAHETIASARGDDEPGVYRVLLQSHQPEWVVKDDRVELSVRAASPTLQDGVLRPLAAPQTRDVCTYAQNIAQAARNHFNFEPWAMDWHYHADSAACTAVGNGNAHSSECVPNSDTRVPVACRALVRPAINANESTAVTDMSKFIEDPAPFAGGLAHEVAFVDGVRAWSCGRPAPAPELKQGITLAKSVLEVVNDDYKNRVQRAGVPTPLDAGDDEYYMLTPDASAGEHDGVIDFDSSTNFSAGQSPSVRIDAFNAVQVFLRSLVSTMRL